MFEGAGEAEGLTEPNSPPVVGVGRGEKVGAPQILEGPPQALTEQGPREEAVGGKVEKCCMPIPVTQAHDCAGPSF